MERKPKRACNCCKRTTKEYLNYHKGCVTPLIFCDDCEPDVHKHPTFVFNCKI